MATNVVKFIAFACHRKVPATFCSRSSSFGEIDFDYGSSSACWSFAPHVSIQIFLLNEPASMELDAENTLILSLCDQA